MIPHKDLVWLKCIIRAAAIPPWHPVGLRIENLDDTAPDICSCDPRSMGQSGISTPEWEETAKANALFIAAARTYLPPLIKEVERLRKAERGGWR